MSRLAQAVGAWISSIGILLILLLAFRPRTSDSGLFVCVAIVTFSIAVLFFALEYRFRRTHTPGERAALAATSQLRRDRIKFAERTALYKRKLLRTGTEAHAIITAATDLHRSDGDDHKLVYLELAVTVGADTPYAVCTGESIGAVYDGWHWEMSSLWIGRKLVVRVDLTNRQRVAVDWKKSVRLRQTPAAPLPPETSEVVMPPQESIALRRQELETPRATATISDVEDTAKREAKETVLGLGDEADQARATHEAEDAAEFAQRQQNWAAIDSFVREFIPEAVQRKTPRKASASKFLIYRKRFWAVRHAQFERDCLMISKNGRWSYFRVNSAGRAQPLAYSQGSRRMGGPAGPNPVDGLREGARRLFNSS